MKSLKATLVLLGVGALLDAQVPSEVCRRLQAVELLASQETREEEAMKTLADRWLQDALRLLREPRPDGTYRWARPTENGGTELSETVDVGESGLTIALSGTNGFGLRLHCPNKKNLFWGNAPVFIRKITLSAGGMARTLLENRRLDRGEEFTQKFGAILPEVKLEIVFERLPGSERSPSVELAVLQAGLADDPGNPQAPLLREIKAMIKAGLDGIAFPEHLGNALTQCPKGMRRELEYILYLLNGTEREQADGRRRLEDLIRAQ